MSLSVSKPNEVNAAFSEAIMYSSLVLPFLMPIIRGRIPLGSLNATNPKPVIKPITA